MKGHGYDLLLPVNINWIWLQREQLQNRPSQSQPLYPVQKDTMADGTESPWEIKNIKVALKLEAKYMRSW